MSTGVKLGIGFIAIIIITIIMVVSVSVGTYNQAIFHEKGIKAQYEQNQNSLSNYYQKVNETAQVPGMYTEDFKSLIASEMGGRYGKDGSKAMFQFLQEHAVNFDSSMYKQIQQVIEAGRDDFAANQKMLLDKVRLYGIFYDSAWPGGLARAFGFPKIDMEKYGKIVSDDYTQEAFETKKMKTIKLRETK